MKIEKRKSDKYEKNIPPFPLRGVYFLLAFFLTLFSLIRVSVQSELPSGHSWLLDAEFQVNYITLILVFLMWLPILAPWVISIYPRFQSFLVQLRESGLEEIEAGILRIKLTAGIEKAADIYENKVLISDKNLEIEEIKRLEDSYNGTLKTIAQSIGNLPSSDAMKKIEELEAFFDRVRETIPSGNKRAELMRSIEATMWALIPFIEHFPVRAKLNSAKSGERMSAYKFLEWSPDSDNIDLLLARAIGVLEVPFAQFAALRTLRIVINKVSLDKATRDHIMNTLQWNSKLDFLVGEDRLTLMESIITIIKNQEDRP